MNHHPAMTTLDSIKKNLVALRMPRALEVLDATFRRIEQGEIDGIEALDTLLVEELTIRENRRVKTALMMARLTAIKTLAGFDFGFQPSLDRNRIQALAELKFIDRAEVVHLLGPPGTGKSHLATALAVEAVKAGRSVAFSTTSSPRWPGPKRTERCASASAMSAAPRSWSSTRSAICRSCPAAAICSSSSSTPATRRAP
jgi:hypothetical protein